MKWHSVLVFGLLLCVAVVPANAGVLKNMLSTGSVTLEDGSREVFIDLVDPIEFELDGVTPKAVQIKSIDVGDVLIGFSRIDKINAVPVSPADSVYAIFSQQFTSIDPIELPGTDADTQLDRDFTLGATTTVGLRLFDLLGPLATAAGLTAVDLADSMVGIVSAKVGDFGINLETTSPGDRDGDLDIDFADYLDVLQDLGDLDLVFELLAANGDSFAGAVAVGVKESEDFITDLSVAVSPAAKNLVNFEGDLSVKYNGMGPNVIVGLDGLVVGGTARRPGTGENVDGIFTFVDDADLLFDAQVVPEPATLAVWGVFGLGGVLLGARRRTK